MATSAAGSSATAAGASSATASSTSATGCSCVSSTSSAGASSAAAAFFEDLRAGLAGAFGFGGACFFGAGFFFGAGLTTSTSASSPVRRSQTDRSTRIARAATTSTVSSSPPARTYTPSMLRNERASTEWTSSSTSSSGWTWRPSGACRRYSAARFVEGASQPVASMIAAVPRSTWARSAARNACWRTLRLTLPP